jgi:prepilin-type processing-associated H-X9-DG protein
VASKFQVQPRNPTGTSAAGGQCDRRLASSPHSGGIVVGLADGSVRFLATSVSGATWWAALTPANGEVLTNDWN